ncbi:MAG: DNA alkylation repair protein [Lachnospiraceae bacterium]|nr:DNA alkylation repair protein [Lachnospiraceae bacterium]
MKTTKEIELSIIKKFKKTIWRPFTRAINEYELVEDGDKIAVCISGGKDSMLLAKLFQELERHGKKNFDVVFLTMNPGYNEKNRCRILDNAKHLNVPITMFESDIFDAVATVEDSPCYLCARMRRGHLYNKAKELGCNKIALGHHFDDVIETILMGMLYSGQIQTMMPKLHSTNFEGMELIRPLYLVRESDIIHWASYNELEFLRCACRFTEAIEEERRQKALESGETSDDISDIESSSKRKEIKELIASLHKVNPFVEKNIFRSVENVNLKTIIAYKKDGVTYNFLDGYHKEDKSLPFERGIDQRFEGEDIIDKVESDLKSMADEGYKDFHSRLMPEIDKDVIIGVRTPELRKYANQFAKHENDARAFKKHLPHRYYDEMNLHGFLIEKNKDFDKCIEELDDFLEYVDNWATCDLTNPKVLGRCKDKLVPHIDRWIATGKTYYVRYAIKLLMTHFLDDDYSIDYMYKVADVHSDEYYVKMMIAWYFATALAKQYDDAVTFLTEERLGEWEHNKTIQKAIESNRIDKTTKDYLRTLKRK